MGYSTESAVASQYPASQYNGKSGFLFIYA